MISLEIILWVLTPLLTLALLMGIGVFFRLTR
jgi:hypothetical protein